MEQVQISLECQKHPQKLVEFFCYNPKSAECNFICSRCVPSQSKEMVVIDLEQALQDQQSYVHNWPPVKDENLHQKIEDSLKQQIDSSYEGISPEIFQQIQQDFDDFLLKLQKEDQNSNYKGSQNFYNDYKTLAKVEEFKTYLQSELEKNQKFENLSAKFQEFLTQICQDSSIEKQLEAKLNQVDKKQESNQFGDLEESLRLVIEDYQNISDIYHQQQSNKLSNRNEDRIKRQKPSKYRIKFDPAQLTKDQVAEIKKNKKITRTLTKAIELNKVKEDFVDYINLNFRYQKFQKIQAEFQIYDHPFELKFAEFNKDNKQSKCDQCLSPTFNYFWKCKKDCEHQLCVDCAYQIPEYKSFFESLGNCYIQVESHRHQLKFTTQNEFYEQQCSNCEREILRFCFGCKPCQFFLCQTCTSTHKEVRTEKSYVDNLRRNNFDFFVQKGKEIFLEQEEILS